MTSQPRSFDEAFRLVSRRRVGGGPKATGADELTFSGDLGTGPLILVSRVRLNEPKESFYTSSNHRLRDSKVGSSGHWIDIRVAGECPDETLSRIRHLAQAVDQRQVIVTRARRAARANRAKAPGQAIFDL